MGAGSAAIAGDAVDAAFETFGDPAVYNPAGATLACIVCTNSADREARLGSAHMFAEGTILEVRAAEVASPRKGDIFAIAGGPTWTVIADPQALDHDRLVWTCRVQ